MLIYYETTISASDELRQILASYSDESFGSHEAVLQIENLVSRVMAENSITITIRDAGQIGTAIGAYLNPKDPINSRIISEFEAGKNESAEKCDDYATALAVGVDGALLTAGADVEFGIFAKKLRELTKHSSNLPSGPIVEGPAPGLE